MDKLRYLLLMLGLALSVSTGPAAHAERAITVGEKAALQATMQKHIQRHLVNGVYLQVDFKTGNVRSLHPLAAHPMILRMGEYFVLCSDFRDDQGRSVNVDFYIARVGKSHMVFQAVVDDRGSLQRLIRIGKAKPTS